MQVTTMQSMIQPDYRRKRLGNDNQYSNIALETRFRHGAPNEYYNTFPAIGNESNYEDIITQSWIPEPLFDLSWNDIQTSQDFWQQTSPSSQTEFSSHHSQSLSYAVDAQDPPSPRSQFYNYGPATKSTCSTNYQPFIETGNRMTEGYANDFLSQTPQVANSRSSSTSSYYEAYLTPSTKILSSNLPDVPAYEKVPNQDMPIAGWIPFVQDTSQQHTIPSPKITKLEIVTTPPVGISLIWSTNELKPDLPTKKRKAPVSSTEKRKYTLLQPATEEAQSDRHIEECVGVFENAPGALATVKKRKKLEAPVRKAARDVRKAGACHQCRFRKRTCSTGTPCGSCLKNGKGLHEIKCQRESPFIGRPVHEYFEYSSTRRVMSFDIRIAPEAFLEEEHHFVSIDGVDRLSHPIKLRAQRRLFSTFNAAEQALIRRTQDRKKINNCANDDLAHVMILEEDETLGMRVEQWAVEYASKFVHAAGTKFRSTTIAVILGTAYVKKGLPESTLVATMLRVASIAFVLRAGVKCTSTKTSEPASQFRTTEATIDTILYQRLQIGLKELFQMLQRIVFRKAGFLTREQVYPVALVFWQLLRISCLGASHLSNIARRFNSDARTQSDAQYLSLKLVLSTHLALFRSSNPLLLDFSDKANHDLVGSDAEIIQLAGKMRDVVLSFRDKGFPEMKGSLAYRKEIFDLFRSVYDGL